MTNSMTHDVLGLAEAVASGELSLEDAEARLGATMGSSREPQEVHDLRGTIAAIHAVRAHARATLVAEAAKDGLAGPMAVRPADRPVGGLPRGPIPVARPGAITPVLPGPVRSRSRRVSDGRTLAVAAAFVVVAGALGFAFAGNRAITPTPRPSANGLATFATIAPSMPPAVAAFKASDHPEVFASANSFVLTSATVGWLRTYEPASKTTALYRTTDAGATWTDLGVAPVGADRFVDDTTAYVATGDGRILATHDGGATWQASAIATPAGATIPWFLTATAPDVAFATFAGPDTTPDLLVDSTSDGGATWGGPAHGTTAVLDPSFNKPQGGEHGLLWMTLGKADNKPFDNRVAISADGGATWSIQPLPADSTFPASSLKGLSAVREDDGGEVLVISDGASTGIYSTSNRGSTWTKIRTWSDGAGVELRTSTLWTATTPTAFWSTSDGGRTWRETPRDAEPPVVDVTFATPDVGWAEVVCSHRSWQTQVTPPPTCGGRSTGVVLMATADGGATWTPIGQ